MTSTARMLKVEGGSIRGAGPSPSKRLLVRYEAPAHEALARMRCNGRLGISDEAFPESGPPAERCFDAVWFNDLVDTDTVIRSLEGAGLRPATFRELLAYAEAFKRNLAPLIAVGLGSSDAALIERRQAQEKFWWRKLMRKNVEGDTIPGYPTFSYYPYNSFMRLTRIKPDEVWLSHCVFVGVYLES